MLMLMLQGKVEEEQRPHFAGHPVAVGDPHGQSPMEGKVGEDEELPLEEELVAQEHKADDDNTDHDYQSLMRKSLPTIAEASNVDLHTPDDKNEQIPQMNETWFPCSTCQELVNLCSLRNHKQCHRANKVLGCKPEDNPSNLHILTVQKEKMVSRIGSSSEYKYREHQKINQSYETLKGNLLSIAPYNCRTCMPFEASCHVYDMGGDSSLIKSIVICSDKNTSWQSCMEDSFTVHNNYGQRPNTCFAGIFDGYHGNVAAITTATEFPILLLDHISAMDPSYKLNEEEKLFIGSFDTVFKDNYKETEHIFSIGNEKETREPGVEGIQLAYAKAFWRMERLLKLGRAESSKSRWSGCSAVTCLLDGFNIMDPQMSTVKDKKRLGMLHVANIGNIKAVLCKNGKSHCLTRDHSPANGEERKRVLESGGSVSSNESCGLIEGFSRVTRGLGFHGDPQLKNSVIPAPYTISIPIYNSCQFLILASSGLWDVLNSREVVAMAQDLLTTFLMYPQDRNRGSIRMEEDFPSDVTQYDDPETPEDLHATSAKANFLGNSSDRAAKANNTSQLYDTAAASVCRQIVKAAMLAGSQQNITVCLILLPGCEKATSPEKSSS
ncbi:protein phosphatase 2C-like domain-containing protein 1 [Bufo bufo]|uniref:protein phosphatase 2C-like domain-containing protein 1 n=1 Tax=Bufo bufo TaxID=8384 RepID=UPI001ABEC336|nr:protein phosphatase 2C-like domain-containing protein 1 [Bufo bufo]